MANGRETCFIESPIVRGSYGWQEIMERMEAALYSLGGRPHWGKFHHISGARDRIAKLYPAYPKWQAAHDKMNTLNLFRNRFTDRCGFSDYQIG